MSLRASRAGRFFRISGGGVEVRKKSVEKPIAGVKGVGASAEASTVSILGGVNLRPRPLPLKTDSRD